MKIRWTEGAATDLEQISGYIAPDSPERANAQVESLLARIDKLADFPLLGRQFRTRTGEFLRELVESPYHIVYQVHDAHVIIVAIVHGKRDLQAFLRETRGRP